MIHAQNTAHCQVGVVPWNILTSQTRTGSNGSRHFGAVWLGLRQCWIYIPRGYMQEHCNVLFNVSLDVNFWMDSYMYTKGKNKLHRALFYI